MYKDDYEKARAGLLVMLLLTIANLAIVLIVKSETVFVFTAAIPEIALGVALGVYYSSQKLYIILLAGLATLVVLTLYFLCWLFSKKNSKWLTTALVVFIIDCVVLVVWFFWILSTMTEGHGSIDVVPTTLRFVFSAWIMYYLVCGVNAAKRLKRLPPEEE